MKRKFKPGKALNLKLKPADVEKMKKKKKKEIAGKILYSSGTREEELSVETQKLRDRMKDRGAVKTRSFLEKSTTEENIKEFVKLCKTAGLLISTISDKKLGTQRQAMLDAKSVTGTISEKNLISKRIRYKPASNSMLIEYPNGEAKLVIDKNVYRLKRKDIGTGVKFFIETTKISKKQISLDEF